MTPRERHGALAGFAAYLVWGLFPFYFHALAPASPWEIIAHRILWSLLVCLLALAWQRQLAWLRPLVARPRLLGGLAVAAGLIAVNWAVYVGAVLAGNATEAALGYFLNPLFTVALGMVVLGEPLRRGQATAVAIGAVAAVYLAVVGGQVPVVALTLATSFALYGLIKKRVGADLPALHGLTVETAVLLPLALVLLGPLAGVVGSTWATEGTGHLLLLAAAGPVTAIPLLLFATAARRVRLVTIGLLQFVTPVMQLLSALALGERVTPARWVGFAIVWVALGVLTVDSARHRTGRPVAG